MTYTKVYPTFSKWRQEDLDYWTEERGHDIVTAMAMASLAIRMREATVGEIRNSDSGSSFADFTYEG